MAFIDEEALSLGKIVIAVTSLAAFTATFIALEAIGRPTSSNCIIVVPLLGIHQSSLTLAQDHIHANLGTEPAPTRPCL